MKPWNQNPDECKSFVLFGCFQWPPSKSGKVAVRTQTTQSYARLIESEKPHFLYPNKHGDCKKDQQSGVQQLSPVRIPKQEYSFVSYVSFTSPLQGRSVIFLKNWRAYLQLGVKQELIRKENECERISMTKNRCMYEPHNFIRCQSTQTSIDNKQWLIKMLDRCH